MYKRGSRASGAVHVVEVVHDVRGAAEVAEVRAVEDAGLSPLGGPPRGGGGAASPGGEAVADGDAVAAALGRAVPGDVHEEHHLLVPGEVLAPPVVLRDPLDKLLERVQVLVLHGDLHRLPRRDHARRRHHLHRSQLTDEEKIKRGGQLSFLLSLRRKQGQRGNRKGKKPRKNETGSVSLQHWNVGATL